MRITSIRGRTFRGKLTARPASSALAGVRVGTPVDFELTSSGVMNSFFVPQLGSQIYTMAGMVTRLELQADHHGTYRGLSANCSGAGFADMRFDVNAVSAEDFARWVDAARSTGPILDPQEYAQLVKPSQAIARHRRKR